jgi:hypothetical protein
MGCKRPHPPADRAVAAAPPFITDPALPVSERLDRLYEHIARLDESLATRRRAADGEELERASDELRLLQRRDFAPTRAGFEREVIAPLDRILDTIQRAREFLGNNGRPPTKG